ncbi:MAG: cyclic nucleotide-binding domain-containing protein [Magnetococcus sp. YQC-5]
MQNVQVTSQEEVEYRWLQDFGYLGEFESKECQEFLQLVNRIYAQDGETLFEAGERGHQIFIIRQGQVQMGRKAKRGQWMDMGPFGCVNMDEDQASQVWHERVTLGEGDCVGEVTFKLGQTHEQTAMAVGDVSLLCLNVAQLRHLAKNHPKLCRCFSDGLMRSLKALEQKRTVA